MNLKRVILLAMVLIAHIWAFPPVAGDIVASVDGTIGVPFGGVVKDENTYGDKVSLTVYDGSGAVIETTTVDYRHFNWSGGISFDIFVARYFSIGINGGYDAISQQIVAKKNLIEQSNKTLEGNIFGHGALSFAIPVNKEMFVQVKFLGGYAKGKLRRVPTALTMTIPSATYKAYLTELNKDVDISGPSAAFEVKLNIFRTTGLMGSIGVRYGIKYLTGTAPTAIPPLDFPVYESEAQWFDQSVSAVFSVGFGSNMKR